MSDRPFAVKRSFSEMSRSTESGCRSDFSPREDYRYRNCGLSTANGQINGLGAGRKPIPRKDTRAGQGITFVENFSEFSRQIHFREISLPTLAATLQTITRWSKPTRGTKGLARETARGPFGSQNILGRRAGRCNGLGRSHRFRIPLLTQGVKKFLLVDI